MCVLNIGAAAVPKAVFGMFITYKPYLAGHDAIGAGLPPLQLKKVQLLQIVT
jgi:hypothetical protein